ncbi:hypothetical protein ACPV4H_09105 [Vibrio rotiferianus]|uniref:hypothetical protein n=1 Tax=Vibrio rotiferianus TaxID=190895 RepID=UPI00406A65DF
MNSKQCEDWEKSRRQGMLSWVLKSTVLGVFIYIIFDVVFEFIISNDVALFTYLNEQILNYLIFLVLMFFGFWGRWVYNESQYEYLKSRVPKDKH